MKSSPELTTTLVPIRSANRAPAGVTSTATTAKGRVWTPAEKGE